MRTAARAVRSSSGEKDEAEVGANDKRKKTNVKTI